jgi:translation initiation factor IF-1
MPKEDHVELAGTIVDTLGGGQYSVKITESGTEIRARLCGKMKQFRIRVIPGDRVKVAVSPYDTSHGMITYRERT